MVVFLHSGSSVFRVDGVLWCSVRRVLKAEDNVYHKDFKTYNPHVSECLPYLISHPQLFSVGVKWRFIIDLQVPILMYSTLISYISYPSSCTLTDYALWPVPIQN
jgi:hypothetical protein